MDPSVRILFIGEIVGRAGIYCVKTLLPGLKRELGIDLTIAAAEGATGGFGIGKGHAAQLHKLGVDVITTGDFAYFKRDIVGHLAQAPYMLRPANYPHGNPGRGWLVTGPRRAQPTRTGDAGSAPAAGASGSGAGGVPAPAPAAAPAAGTSGSGAGDVPAPAPAAAAAAAEAATGSASTAVPAPAPVAAPAAQARPPRVGIISLLGQAGFHRVHLRNPFEYAGHLIERVKQDTPLVLVDFHATTTAEKVTMSTMLDGKVTAVIGTHVRTLSADARLLPRGTAAITHSGRTGSLHSVAGLDPATETRKLLNQVHEQSQEAWGPLELQGVVLEVAADGTARSISTLRRPTSAPETEQAEADPRPQRRDRQHRRGDRR